MHRLHADDDSLVHLIAKYAARSGLVYYRHLILPYLELNLPAGQLLLQVLFLAESC